jgi:hypothetical protein
VEARSSDAQLARMWDELTAQTERKVSHFIEILKVAGIVRPASEDLPGLVDALLGMTVWLLLKAGPTIASADREELVEVISSVWVASVWGVPPGSETTAGKTVSVVHGGPRAT